MNRNEIICGDNAQVLARFPDGCIDLTVTSPPYDNLRSYNGFTWDFEALAAQLYRVTKVGGVVVWVVGDATVDGSETTTSAEQKIFFHKLGFNIHDTMIYETPKMPMNDNRYQASFEFMFVFSKGTPATFNPIKDKKNTQAGLRKSASTQRSADGSLRLMNKKSATTAFSVRDNIWRIDSGYMKTTDDKYAYNHPAMFPESLARDHILSWSNPGDLVLDPFIGSGTTAKMAKETGRDFIGIDISEEYCKLARKRIAGANVPLFTI